MNETINKLIYESGLIAQGCWDKFDEYDRQALNKFAALVAAAEREACAQVCEVQASVIVTGASEQYQEGRSMGTTICADEIRARGKK